jgi:LPXTG-motif cell wall-anchored protein
MSILSPVHTADSIIERFRLGITTIAKPGNKQISVLCGKDDKYSPKAEELSLERLELCDDKLITPVHVHPGHVIILNMNPQTNNSTATLLMLIIALLLITGGYYFYSNKKPSPITQDINSETRAIVTSDSVAPVKATTTKALSVTETPAIIATPSVKEKVSTPTSSAATTTPVTVPSIKITNPNGGEMWKEGQTQVVQWSAQNIVGNQSVKLVDLNNRVVMTITSDIAANNTSTGLYQISWVLPSEFVSEASPIKYKILVSANNGSALDYSDTPFIITADGKGI